MSLIDKKLVERINNIYNNLDAVNYDKKHQDIWVHEKERWNFIFDKYLRKNSRNKILDYGCGTGFLSSVLAEYNSDLLNELICFDPSEEMLNYCHEKISNLNYNSNFQILYKNSLEEVGDCDVVVLNSVLHHLPDIQIFFQQVDKLLKRNGLLIIGHEPNKSFFNNKFLFFFSKLISYIFNPKVLIIKILELFHLKNRVKKFLNFEKNKEHYIINEINKVLISEGLINKELLKEKIYQYIDYHSPTASGRLDKERGFDKSKLMELSKDNFDIIEYNTYDFLGSWSDNSFLKLIDKILSRLFLGNGSKFYLVLKKK